MNKIRLSGLDKHSVTKRYVFVIEYCCKPAERDGETDNCHGWIRYQTSKTSDQLQKPFKEIDSLPQLISDIVATENQGSR
jgi:hypothetical protein